MMGHLSCFVVLVSAICTLHAAAAARTAGGGDVREARLEPAVGSRPMDGRTGTLELGEPESLRVCASRVGGSVWVRS